MMTDDEAALHPFAARVAAALHPDDAQQFRLSDHSVADFVRAAQELPETERERVAVHLVGLGLRLARLSAEHTKIAAAQLGVLLEAALGSRSDGMIAPRGASARTMQAIIGAHGPSSMAPTPPPPGSFSPLAVRLSTSKGGSLSEGAQDRRSTPARQSRKVSNADT
jgi:hypothetical protein